MGYDDTGSALRRWPMLGLLVEAFVAEGDPLVVGIDETLERRYRKKISAKGVYRYLRCAPLKKLS
jgi:hypothetical protein